MTYNGVATAADLYFTGDCNLKCVYCFNPQSKQIMVQNNAEIVRRLDSGEYLDSLETAVGQKQLQHLSLKGGEPTLNLPTLSKHLPTLLERFPNLSQLDFSTNATTPNAVSVLRELVDKLSTAIEVAQRDFTLDIQFSLDGPPEIHDANRGRGSCNRVVDTIIETLRHVMVQSNYSPRLRILYRGKPTLGAESIKWMSERKNLYRFYSFYDDWYARLFDLLGWKPSGGIIFHSPTYATPGRYSVEDGKNLAKMLRAIYGMDGTPSPSELYSYDHIRVFDEFLAHKMQIILHVIQRTRYNEYFGELLNCHSCSAGKSSVGLGFDQTVHVCQGTFFYSDLNVDKIDCSLQFATDCGWPPENYGLYAEGKWVSKLSDTGSVARQAYTATLPQTYQTLRFGFINMLCRELLHEGLIDRSLYSTRRDCDLLALYATFAYNMCAFNNILSHGQPSLETVSTLKFLGNGALDIVMRRTAKVLSPFARASLGPPFRMKWGGA